MFTITPARRATICAPTTREQCQSPSTLTSQTARHSSGTSSAGRWKPGAGVVDQHVDRAEFLGHPLRHRRDTRGIRDVELDAERVARGRVDVLAGVSRRDRHAGAGLAERAGEGEASPRLPPVTTATRPSRRKASSTLMTRFSTTLMYRARPWPE